MAVLMPLIFVVVGLVCGAVLVVIVRKNRAFLARAQRAPGVVVGLGRGSSMGSGPNDTMRRSFAPVFRFTTIDGREVEVRSSVESNPPTYRPGDQVTVLYDPAAPEKAKLDKFSERGGLETLVMSILTGVFLAVGVIVAVAMNA